MFQAFCQDLQFGWRLLTKTPGFSIVAICSLALGMGANTAVFTVFDAILLHSLPVRSPQELVLLNPRRGDDRGTLSYPLLGEFSERQQVFEGVLAAAGADFARTLLDGEFLDGVRAESVSGNFFSVLGIEPALGRLFGSQDDQPGGGSGGPVAIIRHGFWQTQFGLPLTYWVETYRLTERSTRSSAWPRPTSMERHRKIALISGFRYKWHSARICWSGVPGLSSVPWPDSSLV